MYNGSHPVSKYKDSFDASNDKPVTIFAALNGSFSNFSAAVGLHAHHTSDVYSNIGLTNVVYGTLTIKYKDDNGY
jgi:hypothetical protein